MCIFRNLRWEEEREVNGRIQRDTARKSQVLNESEERQMEEHKQTRRKKGDRPGGN